MGFLGKSTVIWSVTGSFIIFSDERPLLRSKRFWSGLLIAVTGFTGLSLGGEGIPRGGTLFGIVLVMIACIFMSGYMLSVRYYFKNTNSRTAFSVIALYTSMGTLLTMMIFGEPLAFTGLPLKINALIILSGIIGIGLAHVLYYAAQKVLGSAIASSSTLFSAFYTAILSYIIFDEKLTMLQWVSGLLITAGGLMLLAAQNKVVTKVGSL
jgi:drug/metabolite transporter (DMT)-like permease